MAILNRIAVALLTRGRALLDASFDLRNGMDTGGLIEPAQMEVVGPHRANAVRYQPTPAGALLHVLHDLALGPEEVFVDVGCGKGRALVVAVRFGFRKVIGIEFAAELCEIAKRNLSRAAAKANAQTLIRCVDAADYDFTERETVVYMFNPFDALVLGKVMGRLAESLRRAPRKAWIIYMFPRWHTVIDANPMFRFAGVRWRGGREFAVYVHEPDRAIS